MWGRGARLAQGASGPRESLWSLAGGLLWVAAGAWSLSTQFATFNQLLSPGQLNLPQALTAMTALAWLLTAWVLLLPGRFRAAAVLALQGAGATLVLADTLYWRYFGEMLPVGVLFHGGQAMGVHRSVTSLVSPADTWLLAAPLCWGALAVGAAWWARRRGAQPRPGHVAAAPPRARWGARAVASLALSLVAAVSFAGVLRDFAERHPRALSGAWNPPYIAACIGAAPYHAVDAYFTLASLWPEPEDEPVDAVGAYLAEQGGEDHPAPSEAVAAGKNVIAIQVEALQSFAVGLRVGDREVTPNLNALSREGLYFPGLYAQVKDGNTSDAEFMFNTALYPAPRGAAFVRFAHNRFSSLPKAFAERGYETVAMHANAPGFWNRSAMYRALGFERFVSAQDYVPDELVGLGLSDRSFFRQNLQRLKQLPQPFYAWMVTLSSHHPYDEAAQISDLDVGALEGSMLGNYLKSIHYTDAQLGAFIAGLKREGLWDRSLVAIMGDHPGILREERPALMALLGERADDELAWRKQQKVPFFVHVPGDSLRGPWGVAGGQIDVWPTLAHLLGLERPLAFGQNLLAARSSFVVFPDGACLAGDAFYAAADFAGGAPPAALVPPELARARKHLAYSAAILRGDWQPQIEERRRRQAVRRGQPAS